MTNEEKQAIERLRHNASYCITSTETTKIILNLIEKQQAEIEDLKTRKEKQLARFSKYKENAENKHEEIYEGLVQGIEKKDKIIDLMAVCMEQAETGRRGFSCMFRENEECNKNGCKVCIKDYFKNKVETEEK